MIFITGENDTIESIKKEGEIEGDLPLFCQEFHQLNPQVCKSPTQILPRHTPLLIPRQFDPRDTQMFRQNVATLSAFTPEARSTLRSMQEDRLDIWILLGLESMMTELQSYSDAFVKEVKSPLISTPWVPLNNSLKKGKILNIVSGVSSFTTKHTSPFVNRLDKLYGHMMARDILNRDLFGLPKSGSSSLHPLRLQLQQEINMHTREIKQLLPKKLESFLEKLIFKGFTYDELLKMRTKSQSARMARKGKLMTVNFEFLNRTGLEQLKKWIDRLETISKYGKKIANYLGPAVVAYDTSSAAIPRKDENGIQWDRALGTALKGGMGIAVGKALGYLSGGSLSAIGSALLYSGLGVDVTTTLVFLFNAPLLGWVVGTATCATAGLLAGGYITSQSSQLVGHLWETKGEILEAASSAYSTVEKEILSIWESSKSAYQRLYSWPEEMARGIY